MIRQRLYKKVEIKSRKIPYSNYQLIDGIFPLVKGYELHTNCKSNELMKYGFISKNYRVEKGFKVITYATCILFRHQSHLVAVYREAPGYEPNLEDFKAKLKRNIEEHELELQMMMYY